MLMDDLGKEVREAEYIEDAEFPTEREVLSPSVKTKQIH